MAPVYLVLSEEELAKGWVRPYRDQYIHKGIRGPRYPTADLNDEERARYAGVGYVKYEAYPETPGSSLIGRYWTQEQLDSIGDGCGTVTTMGRELSETYAREPSFYGATFCSGCSRHRPVAEFEWTADGELVGS